jgi:ankyrin repeat protein
MKLPSSITQKVFKASFKNCYYPKTFSSNSDGFYTREEFLERFSDDYYPDLIMTLLKHGSVDPSDDDSSSFVSACFYGHLEAVEWMLQDERVVPSAYANSGFILACSSGNSKIVELLLKDERIDPSDQENESIGVACEYGNLEVVKLLLQDGRVVPQITHEDEGHFDNMHQSALVRACESNKIHIVKYLLQSERVTVSLYENVALRSAIVAGHHECVKELLNDPALDLSLYPDSEPDIVTLAKNSGDSTILNLILKLQMKRNHIHKCNQ